MKNVFSFADDASSFLYKVFLPIYFLYWLPIAILIIGSFLFGKYDALLFKLIGILIFAGLVPYIIYIYRIPHYVALEGRNLCFMNRKEKIFIKVALCEVDIEISELPKSWNFEEFLEKKEKALIIFHIKGKEHKEININASMIKAVEFQHWLIEQIKENCPEDAYKGAMKYWIDYEPAKKENS